MTYKRPNPRTKYAGVYAIKHKSGLMYVGGSNDITGRFTHHRFYLRRGTHKTAKLQELWSRDGEDSFSFITLERCDQEQIKDREQHWLDNTQGLLNTVLFAVTGHGALPGEKKREAARKRWSNPEYRAKRQAWLDTREAGRFVKREENTA